MNKVALITGATGGLGVCLTQRFWRAGFDLFLVARNHAKLEVLVKGLSIKKHQNAYPIVCDLSDPEQVSSLVGNARRQAPKIDVLINNAAIQGPIGPIWENGASEWQKTIQMNLLTPAMLSRDFSAWMLSTGGGSIISLSGGGATGPRQNFSAYATAKAGLVRLSETLAQELKEFGVKVNCIAPGAMKTAMLREVLVNGQDAAGEREYSIAKKIFEESGASMDRVADLALFLAGSESDGVTGKLVSAVWDDWDDWPNHLDDLNGSDVYTLRRIAARDRDFTWGDK